MVFITHCDTPALWQTYLSDPASITMEGILIFNNHLLFLLISNCFICRLITIYTILFYEEFSNKFNSRFVHSNSLEIVWTTIPALFY